MKLIFIYPSLLINKFPLFVCHKPHRTSWETTSQFQSRSMVRDIFIWNYRPLLLWRWERKRCNCDWTTLRSHVGELISWACSSSSNWRNFFSKRMELRATPHEIPWQLWGICVLTMLSPDMGTSHGQPGQPIFQHVISFSGVSVISSLQSSSTLHSSGVETSNSARSLTNSYGDASKSNGWRS